jgi:hypothetical protein
MLFFMVAACPFLYHPFFLLVVSDWFSMGIGCLSCHSLVLYPTFSKCDHKLNCQYHLFLLFICLVFCLSILAHFLSLLARYPSLLTVIAIICGLARPERPHCWLLILPCYQDASKAGEDEDELDVNFLSYVIPSRISLINYNKLRRIIFRRMRRMLTMRIMMTRLDLMWRIILMTRSTYVAPFTHF